MRIKAWSLTIIGCSLVILIFGLIKWSEISEAVEFAQSMPEYSETVESVEAKSVAFKATTTVIGNVVVPDHVSLQNELPGIVHTISFLSGERVKKGDTVIQLDVSAELANIDSAAARQKLSNSILNRTKKLRASNAVSAEQLEQAYADLAVIKSEIEVLHSIIRQKSIRAPFDGTLGIHSIKLGQYLGANTAVVSMTGQQDFVWVDFFVPQFYPKLLNNSEVSIWDISDITNTSNSFAHIVAIDDAITSVIRSRRYRAKFDMQLDANTAVEVRVPTQSEQISIAVPNISVLRDIGGNYVYKLLKDDNGSLRAHRQTVKVLATDAQHTFISNGLSEGDLIAAPGAYKLFEGILVNISNSQRELKANVATLDAGV